jgi:hypothetical protein
MADTLKRITALERHAQHLIEIMVRCFPLGVTTEVLRDQFELETELNRQTFYDVLKWVRAKGWIVGGGEHSMPNNLNPNKCWMEAVQETLQKRSLYGGDWDGMKNSSWTNFGVESTGNPVDLSKMTDFEREMWEDLQKSDNIKL